MRNSIRLLCIFAAAAMLLACSININLPNLPGLPGEFTVTPANAGQEGGATGITPAVGEPPLPPPAAAVLRVAYTKAGDIWAWTEGVGSTRLTISSGASNASLSGDGLLVTFLRGGELWVVNSDGTGEHLLVNSAYLASLGTTPGDAVIIDKLSWRPGSHYLFFNTVVVAGEAGYHVPQFDLHALNADDPVPTVVQYEAPGSGGVPYPSPDGSIFALLQPDKVIFMDVNGAFWNVAFTFPMVYTYSEWMYVPQVVWLSAGDAVRLVVPASDPLADPTAPSAFWNVPVSGPPTQLASFISVPVFSSFPYISSSGGSVLYLSEPTPGTNEIHTIDDLGRDTVFTAYPSGSVGLLGWAPDAVSFTLWTPTPESALIMGPGGSLPLFDSPGSTDLKWADMSRYLYLGGGELRLCNMAPPSTLIDGGVTDFSTAVVIY